MNDDTNNCAIQADDSNSSHAEPGVTIPMSALRGALSNAEHAANTAMDTIRDLENQRDEWVRQAGKIQGQIDRMRQEHASRTRHVRTLAAAVS